MNIVYKDSVDLQYDDINRNPGYQVKIRHFVELFILFFGAVFGFKKCKISLLNAQ